MIPEYRDPSDTRATLQIGRRALIVLTGAWLVASAGGFALLGKYEFTPGQAEDSPISVPLGTALPLTKGEPLLVMMVHPHCPCSRASLVELERLLAATPEPPRSIVAFVIPEGVDGSWEKTGLSEQVSQIRGVTAISDVNGELSRETGARTSGHVLFYDATGSLRFSGGITPSRGQEGDSLGKASLLKILAEMSPRASAIKRPVYGCPLRDAGEASFHSSSGKGPTCRRP